MYLRVFELSFLNFVIMFCLWIGFPNGENFKIANAGAVALAFLRFLYTDSLRVAVIEDSHVFAAASKPIFSPL